MRFPFAYIYKIEVSNITTRLFLLTYIEQKELMVKPNGVINNLQLKSYKPGDLFWLEYLHFLMNQSFCDFVKVKHTTSGRLFAPRIGITFVDL